MNSLTNTKDLVTTFTILDDLNAHLQLNKQISGRKPSLTLAEVATISLLRTEYGVRTWKGMYKLLTNRFTHEFKLPSYKSFVLLMNQNAKLIMVLINILLQINQKTAGVIKIIDSTPLPVCRNKRIFRHKVTRSISSRSHSSMGWFYGLKLHCLTDTEGRLLMLKFTTGNADDRTVLDEFLVRLRHSILIADAGYCSRPLEIKAAKNHNVLITCIRNNMKKLASYLDICLLNLRPRIEVLFSILKERLGLITSLPRSIDGYLAHYIHTIFGYVIRKAIS